MGIKSIALGTSILVLSTSVNAAFITTDSITNSTLIDFSTQATGINQLGTLQIGAGIEDITAEGSGQSSGLATNYNGWILGSNGTWRNGMTYISLNYTSTMTFSFNDGPVSSVGGFINSFLDIGDDLIISALDINMNALETYNVTQLGSIVTPSALNGGGFRGIVRTNNDIAYFTVTGHAATLDDLTFSRLSSVPIPAAAWLFGSGLLGLVGLARRKA